MRDVSRFNIRSEEVNKAPKDKFTANNLLGCLYGKKCQFIPITRTENRQSAYFQCVAYSTRCSWITSSALSCSGHSDLSEILYWVF